MIIKGRVIGQGAFQRQPGPGDKGRWLRKLNPAGVGGRAFNPSLWKAEEADI